MKGPEFINWIELLTLILIILVVFYFKYLSGVK